MIKELLTQAPLLMLSLLLLAGCHGGGDDHGTADAHASDAPVPSADPITLEFPNAVEALPGVWGGGQPTREQLNAAAEAGVRTVVNLRMMTEEGAWDEREFVEGLGMRYVHIPIAGPDGVTTGSAGVLARITDDKQTHPLLVHCASGRRVGALIELGQAD